MIEFRQNRTWILLGTGDVHVVPMADTDGRKFLCLAQTEPGPIQIEPTNSYLEPGLPPPDNSVLIESTSLESIDVIIAGLQDLKKLMQNPEAISAISPIGHRCLRKAWSPPEDFDPTQLS